MVVLPRLFVTMSGSSEGVGPGNGVCCAVSTLSCSSQPSLAASGWPSGRDHQLRQAHVDAVGASCAVEGAGSGGSGGSGGSSMRVVSGLVVSGLGVWSTMPPVDTLTWVSEAAMMLPLDDLRLVRKRLGESSPGVAACWSVSSLVAPLRTPILSVAVATKAGALDRQLPVPFSHVFLLPRSVCRLGVAGGYGSGVAVLRGAMEGGKVGWDLAHRRAGESKLLCQYPVRSHP